MKKRAFLVLILAAMLLSALPIVAHAENQTTATTTLIWSNETQEPEPPSIPAPMPATWEVVIPATLALNDGIGELQIMSNYINLPDDQFLIVTVGQGLTLINGNLYVIELRNSNSDIVRAHPRFKNLQTGSEQQVYPDAIVARFHNSSTTPVHFGVITLSVLTEDMENAPPGTYTGTMNFKIGIEASDDDF